MDKVHQAGIFSSALLDEIRSQFAYVDWDPFAVTHTSNVTGEVYDVKAIVREARKIKPDMYIMIDGVQYSPSGVIDVEEIGAEAYVIAPYKNDDVSGRSTSPGSSPIRKTRTRSTPSTSASTGPPTAARSA